MYLMRSVFSMGLIVALAFLYGCASGPVQTWEGEKLNAGEMALLKAPSSIRIMSVNGKSMPDYLLDNLAVDYQLKPGITRVTYRYESVWASNQKNEEGKNVPVVVRSTAQDLRFNALAGEVYEFRFAQPADRIEAQRLASDFKVELVTAAGRSILQLPDLVEKSEITATEPTTPETVSTATLHANQLSEKQAPEKLPQQSGKEMQRLDALKSIWGSASAEEKKEFLRWAFK